MVSDRTQIPTGAGYALANRLVTSRILPEPFRDNHVHRLAGFFREVQNTLAQLAPRQAGQCRAWCMLTPGPHNETYFEQAYLARYLGYMLVEGQDLTVRDNHVFLKTLSGLERVDVILRRVDDDFCDPLELRNDSMLGVPGLVEAVRAGNVAVANALGSGLVQSPAFMSFLPGLCQHLLGEELKLPSVATWWCGQKAAREHVLENLDRLVVKPAFRTHLRLPIRKAADAAERDELKRRIEFDPDLFVAQERVEFSTAPAWDNGALVARPVGLRVFLVATASGYSVMPGGLTRVSPDSGGHFISMQQRRQQQGHLDHFRHARRGNHAAARCGPKRGTAPHGQQSAVAAGGQFFLARPLFGTRRRHGASAAQRAAAVQSRTRAAARCRCWRRCCRRWKRRASCRAFPRNRNCGRTPRRSRRNCWRPFLIRRAPAACGRSADHLQRLAMLVRDRTSNDMWRVLSQLNDRLGHAGQRAW